MEANELFGICTEMAQSPPSDHATRRLHELLVLTAAEGCRRVGGAFGNLFSQVDFLCKKHGMGNNERREMHTMRQHANTCKAIEPNEWPYDLRAIALLVSAVFAQDVPGSLRELLPSQPRPREKGLRINLRHLRCIVQSWDDTTITARTADGTVLVDYANDSEGRDHRYLRRLLTEGMQLNLLDCYMEEGEKGKENREGRVVPGIVVVEPDFLVDISSIAACFTGYGHHPLLYTVNRMKPKANTQAILLGNFAGTALDNIIHRAEGSRATTTAEAPCQAVASSIPDTLHTALKCSFREQALRYCACTDFDPVRFKEAAKSQIAHIVEAVSILFDRPGDRQMPLFMRSKALLEPSFVCERLGLQGRVDLMTTDLQLLVEQKAGKNPKIEHQSHDPHGLQLESHYVQLLLYYGVLRYNFGRSDRQVDIRLLYSRYPAAQGLLSVAYYQQLLREAIALRNQIVATELFIAREGFGRIVPLLCSDVIYKDVSKDRFFHEYVEPELSALSHSLLTLTPLERAYFERMATFVYREQLCQKLGSSENTLHHTGGAASDLWLMPVAQKQESGNIFMGMTVVGLQSSEGGGAYDRVTLSLSGGYTGQENFRRGDPVCLYSYREEPDVRQAIVYKGALDDMGTETITVRLNNGQHNAEPFRRDDVLWAVEHDKTSTSASAGIRGLYAFVTADERRKALLLGQRQPEADESVQLTRSYHPNYDDVLLRAMQSRDYFLLVGPPGTGKTSMALRFLVEESLKRPCSLLLMAYTNRAVDEICAMLTDARQPYLRIGNEASTDPRFRDHLLEQALAGSMRLDDMRLAISQTPVIVGTTSMMQSRQEIFELKHFALTIVDEASQILEPSIVGLLASPCIDRFILIGDHKQLPAVVGQSENEAHIDHQQLREHCIDDCRQSLFERLLRWEQRCGRTRFVGTLRHQGRMHPLVAHFPAAAFYAREQLRPVPLPHQQAGGLDYDLPAQDWLDEVLQSRRVLFFDVDGGAYGSYGSYGSYRSYGSYKSYESHNDKSNPAEACLVADLLRRIHRFYGSRFSVEKTVGVIVPYRNQIAAIRQAIACLGLPELLGVTIDTVERYQGSQRDVIIYSFTITRDYQLDFLTANTFVEDGQPIDRKLNVALTRARCQMLITGCTRVLRRNPLFRQLIERYQVFP